MKLYLMKSDKNFVFQSFELHLSQLHALAKCVKSKRQYLRVHKWESYLARVSLHTVLHFTYTGVDFFEPIFVTVHRHKEKQY